MNTSLRESCGVEAAGRTWLVVSGSCCHSHLCDWNAEWMQKDEKGVLDWSTPFTQIISPLIPQEMRALKNHGRLCSQSTRNPSCLFSKYSYEIFLNFCEFCPLNFFSFNFQVLVNHAYCYSLQTRGFSQYMILLLVSFIKRWEAFRSFG